ncbi:MAG: hypothetical protein AAFQ80_15865 [Cyanobacteria bacterium J06621_8]
MTITQLTTNGTAERPDIYGNQIVWTQNGNEVVLLDGNSNIVLPNLGGNSTISPQISANGVMWQGWVNGWNTFYYDGNTTLQITDNDFNDRLSANSTPSSSSASSSTAVDGSGDNLVWSSYVGGNWEIFYYDGSQTIQVTDSVNGGENADAGEDVALEYSIDDGTQWQRIAIYDTEDYTNWTGISESIPLDAQTDSTLFRWTQIAHSGSRFDNWALDNIQIEPFSS